MKEFLSKLLAQAVEKLYQIDIHGKFDISIPQERYGDYSSNAPIRIAQDIGKPIFEIAKEIAERLSQNNIFEKVEPMKNGFINFKLGQNILQDMARKIIAEDGDFGKSTFGRGKNALVEFVSANPTGPLHVGHGRWAVIGDDIANLLEAVGYTVTREYYINDTGNQIDNFENSVKASIEGREIPEKGYGGGYVHELARKIGRIGPDLKEKILDEMVQSQKQVLEKIGVKFDRFFSEESLHKKGLVKDAVLKLELKGTTFVEDGAVWFKSKEFGDDKNRVLVRENGETTYFAADIAYHLDKYLRGYDLLINIWGADHHGYVSRLRAALKSLGLPDEKFEVIIGQLVSLFRGKEPVRMSKRTGEMVTLEEVVDEVRIDAARFFMAMTSVNSHMSFDLKLAAEKAQENPVYYVQYAHARICSIINEAAERGIKPENNADLSLLTHESERKLMLKLIEFPDKILLAAKKREPHILTEYSRELSALFHNFYHKCRVLTDDKNISKARLSLILATRVCLRNVLKLLKVNALERM